MGGIYFGWIVSGTLVMVSWYQFSAGTEAGIAGGVVAGLVAIGVGWLTWFNLKNMRRAEAPAPGDDSPETAPDVPTKKTGGIVAAFRESSALLTWGIVNPALLCPHCQAKGQVRTKRVEHKKGISGAKVMGAVIFSPLVLLATGLSRKETVTQAHCDSCGSTWSF